jgi:DNA-binding MarR family transcriptional regulator
MAEVLPLSALLSRLLVAFTIEFDNEFEHHMPHWTTKAEKAGGERTGVWLVSMAMCLNVMRLVPKQGIPVPELQRQARTEKLNLGGMERWRYLTVDEDTVRATQIGLLAKKVWKEVFPLVERRWVERFGPEQVAELRHELLQVICHFEWGLPAYLPILGYGLFSEISPAREPDVSETWPLPVLLARVLLAFALRFERKSPVSLAVAANVLRLLGEDGVRVRDLPRLSGVSKESIQMALGFLEKRGYAAVDSEKRTKMVGLTAKGLEIQLGLQKRLAAMEQGWEEKFGNGLRRKLEHFSFESLLSGMQPYPDGWRASEPAPETLPYYPMVLHRGGYPDGS